MTMMFIRSPKSKVYYGFQMLATWCVKIVGAGLVPARVLSNLAGRDKPCPYNYFFVALN
jgi:hypothetical protein